MNAHVFEKRKARSTSGRWLWFMTANDSGFWVIGVPGDMPSIETMPVLEIFRGGEYLYL
jgi:hypothetical protein